jgi:superfamily II DNA or RNA helicase
MRDAQIEAIKTYLFLKIGCGNRPLAELFIQGSFNNLDLNEVEISSSARASIASNTAAAALLEYAMLKNDVGEQVSEKLEKHIKRQPDSIDYIKYFSDTFYNVSYTDYLFSLPMGAGKTFLMAAFIYLDLYFALNEPSNPVFAHNFIIFAPSGLKSSVVPSLKTIQKFDPSWVIPQPAASDVKRRILFEVLDKGKTASKSNKTKNPNVQKIANHQPLPDLFGLVAVTNAEKVILDRIKETDGQLSFRDESEDDKDRQANELRNLIGKLPYLSIFIDEVHHAVSDEIKLRAVVNKWSESNAVNSVIGFSGTPYLEKAEKRNITSEVSVASLEISNIVYYYPLIEGVGNFLKSPVVKISDVTESAQVIEAGVREFLGAYKDKAYAGGIAAKLGIYCGSIEKLEQIAYPIAARIAGDYGLSPESILKFHKGNKDYPQPADSQLQFDILDTAASKIRIVLLVQIGKEGWDCRSLTGIILSQEGDCPKNMVLQTSCRCLRQVERNMPETALIYLNGGNAKKLNEQLQQQHHISLKEFQSPNTAKTILKRYDRTDYLKLPPVRIYQLAVRYDTQVTEAAKPSEAIPAAADNAKLTRTVKTQDFSMAVKDISFDESEHGNEPAAFASWLYSIAKSSFGFISMEQLSEHSAALKVVFDTITYEKRTSRYYSSQYNRALVESNIRKAFYEKRTFATKEELIPEEAYLLNISNFTSTIETDSPAAFFPTQEVAEKIILDDSGMLKIDGKMQTAIVALEAAGLHDNAEQIRKQHVSHPAKNRSFHYLPYKTDSSFEQTFLREVLVLPEVERLGLEVYCNGDRALTEFKIRCCQSIDGRWKYIGMYTPDFLVIKRNNGEIHKAVIAETKGKIYANDPTFIDKRHFMEHQFTLQNNKAFGYNRFDYLYLEDTLPENQRIDQIRNAIKSFFEEETTSA